MSGPELRVAIFARYNLTEQYGQPARRLRVRQRRRSGGRDIERHRRAERNARRNGLPTDPQSPRVVVRHCEVERAGHDALRLDVDEISARAALNLEASSFAAEHENGHLAYENVLVPGCLKGSRQRLGASGANLLNANECART